MKRIVSLLLAIAMLISLSGCAQSKPTYAYEETVPSLCEAYSQWFDLGAAINSWNLDSATNEYQTITRHFNVFTLENEAKPDAVHPAENSYNFANVDKFVEFGEEQGVTLRGHTLIWHSQCPDWFFYDGNGNYVSAEVLLQRIDEHVTTIVSRYAGKIDTWDVVNEVIGDGGGLRDSNWYKIVGDYDGDGDKYDYIEQAFISARAADPDARLIINDYSLESSESKAIAMYLAVKKMLEDGTPIDGIGLQMHIGYNTDVEQIRKNFDILKKLRQINPDFIFEVTELDMSVYDWGESGDKEYSKEVEKQQVAKYREVFELFVELAEEGILDTVVFWGIHDGVSWLNGYPEDHTNYPMLIGRELKLKSSFWEVLDVAAEQKE